MAPVRRRRGRRFLRAGVGLQTVKVQKHAPLLVKQRLLALQPPAKAPRRSGFVIVVDSLQLVNPVEGDPMNSTVVDAAPTAASVMARSGDSSSTHKMAMMLE